jgi:hypothetical protein
VIFKQNKSLSVTAIFPDPERASVETSHKVIENLNVEKRPVHEVYLPIPAGAREFLFLPEYNESFCRR